MTLLVGHVGPSDLSLTPDALAGGEGKTDSIIALDQVGREGRLPPAVERNLLAEMSAYPVGGTDGVPVGGIGRRMDLRA